MRSPSPASVDLVVIGSGAAGLAAALTASEGGARVVVCEKQNNFGGTSNFFEGTFAVESTMQQARYITYSRDEAFKNIMDYSHWRANPRLVRTIVNESAATITWLQEQGVEFIDVPAVTPNSSRTYHVIRGRGGAVVKVLVNRAKQAGAELLPATTVKRILKSGESVSGAVYERDNGEVQVKAKAVIIASGGFANNKEWIRKYTGFDLGENLTPVGNIGKTGDGIRMAFEAGAAEEGMETVEVYRVGPIGTEFAMGCHLEFAATQPDLWVNPRGERFCDESTAFYDTEVGNASTRCKGGYSFSLFDDSIKNRMLEKGIEKNVAIAYPPGSRPLSLEKEIKAALAGKSTEVFEADSVEEMARKINVDPAVLKATVDEYNRFCEKGHDELFAKDRKYLWPLHGPRFYAVRARTVFLGTMGGIKINERMEVIDKKEKVIPGLYAAGYDAGGMYGDGYCIRVAPGLSSAFALNSGRIAARNVLKYLGRSSA
jgi:fumarate reductase flavoprotein subunit